MKASLSFVVSSVTSFSMHADLDGDEQFPLALLEHSTKPDGGLSGVRASFGLGANARWYSFLNSKKKRTNKIILSLRAARVHN